MNFFHAFYETIETILVKFWQGPERMSLMRVIYEIYAMDGDLLIII